MMEYLLRVAELANNRKVLPLILALLFFVTITHASITHTSIDADHDDIIRINGLVASLQSDTHMIEGGLRTQQDDLTAIERRMDALTTGMAVNTAILKRLEQKLL